MSSLFGGGSSKPKPPKPAPEPQRPKEESRRIVEGADKARQDEVRKRIPPGRKATLFAGLEKALKDRLGQ